MVDKLIIGAGLYGLYAALYCARRGQRVTVLEATKLVAGVFKSTNIPNDIIELGSTPEAVILSDAHGANQVCFITKAGSYVGNGNVVVVENGFQLVNGGGSTAVNNGRPICFFAFG